MKILVIGASRGIGLETLKLGLAMGHEMSALVRNPENISLEDEHLSIVRGDILDRESVDKAVRGQDAVCISVGIKPTRKPTSVFSEGTKNVVDSMRAQSCKVLLCVTGIGAGESRGHGGFMYDKIFNPLFLKTIYEDKDRQEMIVRQSGLDWTIVRPGFLTNGPKTGKYRVLKDLSGVKSGKVSRADVAEFILKESSERKYAGHAILLTY